MSKVPHMKVALGGVGVVAGIALLMTRGSVRLELPAPYSPKPKALAPTERRENPDRFFKEDHDTGGRYLKVARSGQYLLLAQEDIGAGFQEVGTWGTQGDVWRFESETGDKSFSGRPVQHGSHTFLVWTGGRAPGIEIPEADTRRALDRVPGALPSYVFFETDQATFERETGWCDPPWQREGCQGSRRTTR